VMGMQAGRQAGRHIYLKLSLFSPRDVDPNNNNRGLSEPR